MQDKSDILGFDIDFIPTLLADIIKSDKRHSHRAYSLFGHSLRHFCQGDGNSSRAHIVADCFTHFTIDRFGPMSAHVLKEWGVESADDFADMVANIVQRSESFPMTEDDVEELREGFNFEAAFVEPFEP